MHLFKQLPFNVTAHNMYILCLNTPIPIIIIYVYVVCLFFTLISGHLLWAVVREDFFVKSFFLQLF